MSDNNDFLSNYSQGKVPEDNKPEDNKPAEQPPVKPSDKGYKYEEKSGFKPPIQAEKHMVTKNRKPNRWITGGIIGAVLLGIVLLLIVLLNRGIEIPDFTGWDSGDANLWASDNGIILKTTEEYNDEYESGLITSQDTESGSRIKKGDALGLTISLGHDLSVTLVLPDLMNMTKAQIDTWVEENFMTKVRVTTEYSTSVESGKVIRFEINDNTVLDEIRRDTPLYIIISKGAESETVTEVALPDFKTKTLAECYAFAKENGLELTVEEVYDEYVPAGTIISQNIKAETKVATGTQIKLVASKGKQIIVPDFSLYSKEEAAAVAAGLGITATVVERYSGSAKDAFLNQSIAAGTDYITGDFLELRYSLGNKIVLPSFVGQTRDSLETWAKDLNDQGACISISATKTINNAAAGTIVQQSPVNKSISTSATISITVSLGKAVYVPDFVAPQGSGYDVAVTRDQALAMCDELNIVAVFVSEKKTGRLPGEVWSQSLAAGSETKEGTTITLKYVPADVQITVPDFTGMTKDQIIAAGYYKKFNLKFEEGTTYVSGYDGLVYLQSVRQNTTVAAGSIITLTVGPAGEAATE